MHYFFEIWNLLIFISFGFNQITKMSYLLPHLTSGWEVDQAILSEEDRLVVIRLF